MSFSGKCWWKGSVIVSELVVLVGSQDGGCSSNNGHVADLK